MVVTPHCGDHSLSVEKAADEISATGGPRRLSPIDVNDVLSLIGMFAPLLSKAQYMVFTSENRHQIILYVEIRQRKIVKN